MEELRQRVEEEWDLLDQEVIDNMISEWCKQLTACIAAGRGHFEHSLLCDVLIIFYHDC